jgi:uncharacterized RDD family membrane protein YckC
VQNTAPTSPSVDRRVAVATPEAVAFERTLADLGSRGLAFALDLLLLALVLLAEIVVFLVVFAVLQNAGEAAATLFPWFAGAFIVVAFLSFWGYFIVLEAAGAGVTPGKRAMRIRVVRDDGSRIGAVDAIIRNVLLIADILPGTFAVGVTSILLTPKAQRLGDLAAGTVVVAESAVASSPPAADPRARLAADLASRVDEMMPEARDDVAREVLVAMGEDEGAARAAARAAAGTAPDAAQVLEPTALVAAALARMEGDVTVSSQLTGTNAADGS